MKDSTSENNPQDTAPGRAATAARLLDAARSFNPAVQVTLAELQAAVRSRRYAATHLPARLLLAGATAAGLLLLLGSVALSRGWVWPRRPAGATYVSVPAGATTRIERRGRFRLSLRGPAALEIGDDDQAALRLQAGQVVLSNQSRAVVVAAGGHRTEIPPAATVALEVFDGHGEGDLRVTSLGGPPPRLDGLNVAAGVHPMGQAAPPAPAVAPAPGEQLRPRGVSLAGGPADDATGAVLERRTVAEKTAPRAGAHLARPSPATDEVALVHDALELLRGSKDAAGALRLLDPYDLRFPNGLLRDEVAVTRIEALLALGRSAEAMAKIDEIPAAWLDRSPRLRVARGELLAAHGRCDEAMVDFTAVLSGGAVDDLGRRAARGRAACAPFGRGTEDRGGPSKIPRSTTPPPAAADPIL